MHKLHVYVYEKALFLIFYNKRVCLTKITYPLVYFITSFFFGQIKKSLVFQNRRSYKVNGQLGILLEYAGLIYVN